MIDNDPNVALLAQELKAFLEEAGWHEGQQVRGAVFYMAPKSLGIDGNYSVALPQDPSAPGAASLLHGAANALVDVYGYGSVGDLLNRAAAISDQTMPTCIATRFVDPATRDGAIALGDLVVFVTGMEEALYRCARFKMGDDSNGGRSIARRFARECRFLQTAEGSFVATVEVPITILKQAVSLGGRACRQQKFVRLFSPPFISSIKAFWKVTMRSTHRRRCPARSPCSMSNCSNRSSSW